MICDHEKNMTHINRAPGKLDGKKKGHWWALWWTRMTVVTVSMEGATRRPQLAWKSSGKLRKQDGDHA
jgi:hypothetical protein